MKGKIAFEEHLAIEETVGNAKAFAGESGRWEAFARELVDVDDMRLAFMDKAGIELALLSLNAPAVQAILDPQQAVELARKANNRIADALDRHPRRYAGLAALPMQDPAVAATELERCVN